MQIVKRCTIEETAESFNDPRDSISNPGIRSPSIEAHATALPCILFSCFINQNIQFSDVEKVRLRLALKLVSEMLERVIRVIHLPKNKLDTTSDDLKDNDGDAMFAYQLNRWFGSTSSEVIRRVRKGMFTMHRVLKNPSEIITFVNVCSMQKWTGPWEHYPESPEEDLNTGYIYPNRQAIAGYRIVINDRTRLDKLGMSGMARYIFHQLTYDVLGLPNNPLENIGHMGGADVSLLSIAQRWPDKALRLPGSWTHFFDSFKFNEDGTFRDQMIDLNRVMKARDRYADRFSEACKLSDDSDLYPL